MSRRPTRLDRLQRNAELARLQPAPPPAAKATRVRRKPPQATLPKLNLRMIPLNQLRITALNVNVTNAEEDIASLARSIATRGLKQNLIVVDEGDGSFGVIAGGRRYRALMRNCGEGLIPEDHPIPCLIEAAEEARETSLEENLQRVALNPADEVTAYATIVAEHAEEVDPVAYTARRFNVGERHVAQRLKLAVLAPEIFDALRAGTIRLDAAGAYAGFDDQDLQMQVFRAEEARQFGTKHDPRNIRDSLRGRTYPASIDQALYVGIDAYVAAGGRVDRDLFLGEAEGERLLDPALVDRLAREKAEAELPAAIAECGFGDGMLATTFATLPIWPPAPEGYRFGARAESSETVWIVPAYDVRPTAIGIFAPRFGKLSPIGWFVPIAPAPAPTGPAARPEIPADPVDLQDAGPADFQPAPAAVAGGPFDPSTFASAASMRRADRVRRVAAQLVVERALGHPLDDRTCLPADDGFVPAIAAAEGEDTVIVAVLVRVSRVDWEAALPEAEAQVEQLPASPDERLITASRSAS